MFVDMKNIPLKLFITVKKIFISQFLLYKHLCGNPRLLLKTLKTIY